MQRRRFGDSARRVLDAAWDSAADYPDAPLVYVSHDGEINRSFELWLGLLRDNEVSPTSFGLSGAQCAGGAVVDVARRYRRKYGVGGAGRRAWRGGLAEAYALLHDGPEQVLLVLADEP